MRPGALNDEILGGFRELAQYIRGTISRSRGPWLPLEKPLLVESGVSAREREKAIGSPIGYAALQSEGEEEVRPISVSVIVPTFNEEGTIRSCIEECVRVLAEAKFDYEVIVVDDGSTDATLYEARQTALEIGDGVRVIGYSINRGKGDAIDTGARYASKDILVIQDADLEYSPKEIPSLVLPIATGGFEVVFGSRFLGSTDGMSSSHRFGNWMLTAWMNVLHGTTFTDVMTGHKVFTRRAFQSMGLKAGGFAFEVEVTSKSLRNGLKLAEVPVVYRARSIGNSKIRWTDGVRCVFWILGLRISSTFIRGAAWIRRKESSEDDGFSG